MSGDNAAGAVGNGIVRRGLVSAGIGTSGVVFAHADQIQTDPLGRVHTFCAAVPGKWHVMGVVLAAGGSLQWYRNTLCEAQVPEASAAVVRLKTVTRPDRRNRAAYSRRYAQFRALYASLKTDFARMAALETGR